MDRPIEKKTWTPKRIALIGAGGLFVFFVLYTIVFGDHSRRLNVEADKITVGTVLRGPFQEFIPVTGTVMPIKTIYLDAMEGGRVEKLYVEEGAFVKQGEDLIRLSNTNLQMDVMYREAQLFEQINNLRNTRLAMEQNRLLNKSNLIDLDYQIKNLKRTYDIDKGLIDQKLVSQQEFDAARDQYEYALQRRDVLVESIKQDSLLRTVQVSSLENSIDHMQTNLALIKENLANLTIKAPVTGQLTARSAELGESKKAGDRLGQIDVLDGFKIRAGIDEHYIARIQIGQTGEFDFANKTYHLVIKKVYPQVANGRFEVDMEFQGEAPMDIRRGQTLQVRLELGDLSEAVLLPRGGFYQTTGGQWIYVVDPSGEFAVKRPIKLGRQNPQMFEVLDGVNPGEKVVTSSYDNYTDMDKLILNK